MKRLLLMVCILAGLSASAQVIDLGASFGSISNVSAGLSTWSWLFIGGSYEYRWFNVRGNNNNGSDNLGFCSPMVFIQPTVTIGQNIRVYGAFKYGWWFHDGSTNSINDFIIGGGGSFRIVGQLYANGEVGYFQINQAYPGNIGGYTYNDIHNYQSSKFYGAAGLRILLHTGNHKKIGLDQRNN